MDQARIITLGDGLSAPESHLRSIAGSVPAKAVAIVLIALFSLIANPGLGEITDGDIFSLAYDGTTASVDVVQSPGVGGLLVRLILSLAAVFGLIVLVARLAKKYLPRQLTGTGGNAIEVLATRTIGSRKSLMLVQVEGKRVLLGVTPQNLQFLTHVDHEDLEWGDVAEGAGLARAPEPRSKFDAAHA